MGPMDRDRPVKMDPNLADVLKCVTMEPLQCVLTVTHHLPDLLVLRVLTAPHLPVMMAHHLCVLMAVLSTPLASLLAHAQKSHNVSMDPHFFVMTVASQFVQEVKEVVLEVVPEVVQEVKEVQEVDPIVPVVAKVVPDVNIIIIEKLTIMFSFLSTEIDFIGQKY